MRQENEMYGSFLGTYFANIHDTVNSNANYAASRWGTTRKGDNEGYWSEYAIRQRRQRHESQQISIGNIIFLDEKREASPANLEEMPFTTIEFSTSTAAD